MKMLDLYSFNEVCALIIQFYWYENVHFKTTLIKWINSTYSGICPNLFSIFLPVILFLHYLQLFLVFLNIFAISIILIQNENAKNAKKNFDNKSVNRIREKLLTICIN